MTPAGRGIGSWPRAKPFEVMVATLRRKLLALHDLDEPEERPPTLFWCCPPRRMPPEILRDSLDSLAPGCSAAFLLRDGRVLVGDVLCAGPALVRLWGRETPTRLWPAAVCSVTVVGGHRWCERRVVTARQARREWLNLGEMRG